MAIQTRIINNSFTEIYVGGVNVITEAAPTNFHNFFKQKILTANETISDYKEVTPAERTAIEAADAEAQAAIEKAETKAFDLQWEAIGGTVTIPGKTYEINGGTGTFADAVKAMSYYTERPLVDLTKICFGKSLKLLPTIIIPNATKCNFSNAFQSLSGMKKVVIKSTADGGKIGVGNMYAMFNSSLVEELDCILNVSGAESIWTAFAYASRIREIRLYGLNGNVDLHWAKVLSLASLQYMVANAANTDPITITLHPDAYARVTEDIFAAATAKQITIASA